MSFKLAIADIVTVPMKFQLKDGGTNRQFSFSLQCKRISATEWSDGVRDENGVFKDARVKPLMLELTIGWKGQTLVLDDAGEPAEFCEEAFEVMLGTPGLLDMAVSKYMAETAAKAKN